MTCISGEKLDSTNSILLIMKLTLNYNSCRDKITESCIEWMSCGHWCKFCNQRTHAAESSDGKIIGTNLVGTCKIIARHFQSLIDLWFVDSKK